MSTKIGLVSDVHATSAPLKEALSIFDAEGVDMIFCAGDFAGYGEELDDTVALLIEHDCITITGNHEIWYLEDDNKPDSRTTSYISTLSAIQEFNIEGKNVYMVHASPPQSCMDGIKLLDEHGDILSDQKQQWTERLSKFEPDILVVGHTHQVFAERLGNTLVVNPGSTKFNHSCAILSLPDMAFRVFPLSNKSPVKAWNWGMIQTGDRSNKDYE